MFLEAILKESGTREHKPLEAIFWLVVVVLYMAHMLQATYSHFPKFDEVMIF